MGWKVIKSDNMQVGFFSEIKPTISRNIGFPRKVFLKSSIETSILVDGELRSIPR